MSVQGFGTILGILGLVLAFIVPSLFFIEESITSTYVNAAVFSLIMGCFLFLIIIPGVYEDKKVRNLYQQRKETNINIEVEPFLKSCTRVIRDRTFMMKVIFLAQM